MPKSVIQPRTRSKAKVNLFHTFLLVKSETNGYVVEGLSRQGNRGEKMHRSYLAEEHQDRVII